MNGIAMKGMRILATLLAAIACAQPATAQFSPDETAKSRHILPHIADGDGWRSRVLVTNVSSFASRCRIRLYGLSTSRFESVSGVRASGTTATFELPEKGGFLVWSTRNESGLASGYATLDCSQPVVAQVVFAAETRSGTPTGMATVPSSQAGTVFQFPVMTPAGSVGMAVANDTSSEAYCRLTLNNPQRAKLGETTIAIPSKTNLPAMLNTAIAIPSGFSGGSATVTCNRSVAMIGLHFELRPDRSIITFTTLPPAVLSTSPQRVDHPDRVALEALYDATGGPRWRHRTKWKTSAPLGEWSGVKTDASGRVVELKLSSNNLSGELPAELSNLTHLEQLDLGRNQLSGTVPEVLGNLTRLEKLYLSYNNLSGELPASLTNLRQMQVFWFTDNEGLCLPPSPAAGAWVDGIADFRGLTCGPSEDGDDETGQVVLFSEDFSSGTFDKWTTVGKDSQSLGGEISIVDGVLQMDGRGGGNYSLQAVKEIRVSQPYDGYRLSFDWKAVARETPHGGDGVVLNFYDDQDQFIGRLVAYNSGQTGRGGDPLDHIRPTNLANDRFAGIGKLAETFDWEHVTLDTSMIPGMDPHNVARLELRAWVYNNAGSGGEMYFDNFDLRSTGGGGGSGNRVPELYRPLPGVTLQVGGSAVPVTLGDHFRDPDGDDLSYSTVTMPAGVVNVTKPRDSDVLTFEPVSAGTARVTVTATDPGRLFTRGTIDVTVNPASTTEDPNPGETRTFNGIEFVWIPPGQFQMGSTSSESDRDERPVTQVRISRGFWMGKYEVTQAQWEAVMGSNPSDFTNCGSNCPVDLVTWNDVQEFIGKLNARSGGRPYRLPTEAEWEYAARAGTTEERYGDIDEIAWYSSNSGRRPHPVGEKAANAWGLHDMLGNVWEWVGDWYGSYPGGSVTDPTGPGSGSRRVYRGGSWLVNARTCRSANRNWNSPGIPSDYLGFRLLREAGTGEDDETVLFSEDFESYAVGSLPDDYVFVEGLTGRGRAEQRVESEGGNRHFRVVGRERATASLAKFFDFDLPPVVSVSWRMRVDDDVNTYPYTGPAGAQGTTIGGFFIKNSEDTFGGTLIFKYQSDRKIVAWCLEGGGSRPEVPLGVWTEFRMDINFAAEQYSIYKDGQRFCSSLFPLGRYTSPPGIAFVSGDTVTRFDDIVIRAGSGSGSSGSAVESSEFVWIPPGELVVGSSRQDADAEEELLRRVEISQGFWMGKYEVTQAEWEAVMGGNPSYFKGCGGDCPVEQVDWDEVQEFIGRLNAREGRERYRLPTEAEWEYAARAGTRTDTYAGDVTEPQGSDTALDGIAWYFGNSGRRSHRVGQKAPNGFGLYDMLGNVWEWVGAEETDGSGSERMVRGGSWASGARVSQSGYRNKTPSGYRSRSLGFRLVRED